MIEKIDPSRKNVRKFGILFAVLGAAFAGYLVFRGNPHWFFALAAGLVFLLAGLLAYPVLKPVYIGWMAFASVLAWINTRILLGLFFYLILTPIGLLMRVAKKDRLGERFDRTEKSYWIRREHEEFDRTRYERLF